MVPKFVSSVSPWRFESGLRSFVCALAIALVTTLAKTGVVAADVQVPSGNAEAVAKAAAIEAGWHPETNYPALSPEAALRTIEVPAGYRLQCVASEPMVQDPVMIAFDGNGALYVCEWRTYMQDEFATGQLAPEGRVVKLVDTDGDGVMDRRTVFIDGAILPRAVLPLHDRVLVYFTESSTVYSYFDEDRDGVSDRREVAWQGKADHGNIEHQQSGLLWNLDNTICSNDRRFRWNGGRLEAMSHDRGRIAQFGLARDDDGRLVCSWGGGANPAHSFQLPAGYPILDLNEHGPGYNRVWGISPVWDQSDGGYDRERRAVLTRFSASCGQTVLRSHRMPEWYGNAVTCEPVGRFIRMSRFEWKDGVGTAHNAFPGKEFIRSTDAYFRPVWTENGPDGGLYIADMYRGIIQEKEWFPTEVSKELQDRYVEDYRKHKLGMWVDRYHRIKKWGMTKVVRHGRIYRLLPENALIAPTVAPGMLDETPGQLVSHLAHASGWWRDTAQALLVSRGDTSAVPALIRMAREHASPNARLHAMWTLEGLSSLPGSMPVAALKDSHPRVRRAAVQLLEPRLVRGEAAAATALQAVTEDPDAQVATQVFLAYRAAERAGSSAIPASFRNSSRSLPLIGLITERDRKAAQQRLSDSGRKGKVVYESLCIACHGADGQGVASVDRLLAPPLTKSPWFRDGGNVPVLARILLKGQTGPINGEIYGEGAMMALENTHSDQDLANVLSYIGEVWHGWTRPVDSREIAAVRPATAGRSQPWTHDELVKFDRERRQARPGSIRTNGGTSDQRRP
jgi:mono/diheme cytochrome c family protein